MSDLRFYQFTVVPKRQYRQVIIRAETPEHAFHLAQACPMPNEDLVGSFAEVGETLDIYGEHEEKARFDLSALCFGCGKAILEQRGEVERDENHFPFCSACWAGKRAVEVKPLAPNMEVKA